MGRRVHTPEPAQRRQVEAMSAYGIPEADIARVVGVNPKTLRRHYRSELDTGATKATARVAEFLYRRATTEGPQAVTAAIFWLKTRAGWKETTVQELSAKSEPITAIFRTIIEPVLRPDGSVIPRDPKDSARLIPRRDN